MASDRAPLAAGSPYSSFVSQPTRSSYQPEPRRISQLAEAVNGPLAGLAAACVASGDTCPGCIKSTAAALHVGAPFPLCVEQQLRHSTAGGHRAPASRTADSACAERMSESVDSPVASPTPVCTRWMGWTRLVRSIGRMPVRYSTSSAHNRDQHGDHFRCLWLHGSAHNAVSSRPMAVTECRALLHCMEVHAMRLWPLIERDWLLARTNSAHRAKAGTSTFVGFGCTAAPATPYRVGQWL